MDLTIDDNLIRELGLEKSEEIRDKASKIFPFNITLQAIPGVVYQSVTIALEIDGIKLSLIIPFKKATNHDNNN